jgi:uncharacterized membrane protein
MIALLIYLIGIVFAYLIIRDFVKFTNKTIDKTNFGWYVLLSLTSWILVIAFVLIFICVKAENELDDNGI